MVLSLCDSKMATYCMKRTLQNQIHASCSQLFVAGILPHLTTSISVQLCCFKCCAPEMLRSSLHKKSPNLSLWACSKLSLHLLFIFIFFWNYCIFMKVPFYVNLVILWLLQISQQDATVATGQAHKEWSRISLVWTGRTVSLCLI